MNKGHRLSATRLGVLLLVLGGSAVIAALLSRAGKSPEPVATGPAEPATPVVTTTARRGPITRTVPIAGVIRSESETQLAARMPSRVLAVLVREGDRVRRGQLLVRLDDREARRAMTAAEAGVRAAEAALAKAGSSTVIRRAEVESGVSTAAAAVTAAQARLSQARGAAREAEAEAAAEQRRAQAALDAARANMAAATRGARPAQLRQAEAAVTQADSAAQAARRGLESAQFLYDRGGLTRARLEEARAADETARAQLESAKATLELTREGAPPEERQAAAAAVRQAEAGVEAASAGARRARLARQDAAAAAAQLRQAEAALRAARAGMAGRDVALNDARSAAAALEQARVQQQQAADQLAVTRLVSPADGIVTLRATEPGQIAQPGQPLVAVASGRLLFEAPVTATTVTLLHPKLAVDLTTDAASGRPLHAVLRDVPSVPGADQRTYTVRAALSRPVAASLAPGTRARGTVRVSFVPDAILVPPQAVQRGPEGPVVWVARDGRAERRAVGIGIETDTAVEIVSGVAAGDAVILSGAQDLRPGAAVNAVERTSGRVGVSGVGCRVSSTDRPTRHPTPDTRHPGAQRRWV